MTRAHMFIEKRTDSRVPVKFPVKFRVIEDTQEIGHVLAGLKKYSNGHLKNLSMSGMYIVTEEPLKKGKILSIDFSVQGAPGPLSAFVEVIWSNESGGGLKFLTLKEEDLNYLKTFLEKTPG